MRVGIQFALSTALLLPGSALPAADWIPLGTDERGNLWHLDAKSIARENNTVTSWQRIDFRHPYPHIVKGTPLKRAFVLNKVDCLERKTEIKALSLHGQEDSIIGVHENSGGAETWPPGIRLPMLENTLALVCRDAEPAAL